MINIKITRLIFLLFSFFIALGDQYAKYIIEKNYYLFFKKNYIIFSFDYVKNYGAAFNLFNGNRLFLISVSIIISIFLIYSILKRNNISQLDLFSYSLILGGSIGNGYDRIIKGYVVDFINLNFINFPIFNIADLSINIGFFLILYGLLKYKS